MPLKCTVKVKCILSITEMVAILNLQIKNPSTLWEGDNRVRIGHKGLTYELILVVKVGKNL